jgi:hypothetical protein
MTESHVVSALVDKRAELAGQIVRIEQQLGQFRADLVHVDATIRLFAPALEPETIQAKVIRRRDGWFETGEVKRRVLDTLRRSDQPMGAPGLVRVVMIEKGLDPADRASFAKVQLKVGFNLRQLASRGVLIRSTAKQGTVLWSIADQAA